MTKSIFWIVNEARFAIASNEELVLYFNQVFIKLALTSNQTNYHQDRDIHFFHTLPDHKPVRDSKLKKIVYLKVC